VGHFFCEIMVKYGEIYALGNHRLMCGDATSREDVMRLIGTDHVDLILTDPPYGMKVQDSDGRIGGGSGSVKTLTPIRKERFYESTKYPLMIGDDTSETAKKFYEIGKNITKNLIFWGGQYFADFLPVSGGWIFWDKKTGNSDFSDGELAWVSKGNRVRKYVQTWNGMCMAGSYKLNSRDKQARIHPTQKPVELHMKILEDFTKVEDVVLDCFGGSGTTLIACNETGRKCLMMEISPEYCDIIINRYEKLIGMKAVEIDEN